MAKDSRATQRNATQRNATQRNATQRNATQRNATRDASPTRPPPGLAEHRTCVENIHSADRSSLTADVRITIALDNGDTYTTYRRLRLLREKRGG